MQTSISFILYYDDTIAPLDMANGETGTQTGQISPLLFSTKQRQSFLEGFLYSPRSYFAPILQKNLSLNIGLDLYTVLGVTYTFNNSLDIVLDISGPVSFIDFITVASISSTISLDMQLVNRYALSTGVNFVLGGTRARKTNVDLVLQESKALTCSLDFVTKLAAVYCGLDFIATPSITGSRDLWSYDRSVQTIASYTRNIDTILSKPSTIDTGLYSNSTIQTELKTEVDI